VLVLPGIDVNNLILWCRRLMVMARILKNKTIIITSKDLFIYIEEVLTNSGYFISF
jgi:hypothetical protein